MKTIEELKLELISEFPEKADLIRAVVNVTVEFAQRWINPKDQMPDVGKLVQVKVKWQDHEDGYDHDRRIVADGYDDFEINQIVGLEVIGWRPIDLK